MFEQLFGSKTRVKLFQLFYSNPNRSFYVREITRKIDEQINSVRRELSNLLSIGILTSDANNNRLYYEVSQEYEYYKPLAMIFGGATIPTATITKKGEEPTKAVKTADLSPEHPLAKAARATGHVELALLTGQFTRDDDAEVDILLVGDLNQAKVNKFVSELEKAENKELRYAVMSLPDYNYRVEIHDRFVNGILTAKKQVVINNQDLPINQ
jgi:acylphosphatase